MRKRLALIFTTFPVPTETFLAREVSAMIEQGVDLELWSLWKGERAYEGIPVIRTHWGCLLTLFYWLPYWFFRKPKVVFLFMRRAIFSRYPSWLNRGENLLGMGMGLVFARKFERGPPRTIHAVWATGPTSMAWLIKALIDRPYSFGAHAYDLFESGGDRWLKEKISEASWVRSSTEAGCNRILELGGRKDSTVLIRRGLSVFPKMVDQKIVHRPVRILGVGRMVEKMGYEHWLRSFKGFLDAGIEAEGVIIGGGPMLFEMKQLVEQLGISDQVRFLGAQPFNQVETYLGSMDLLLFTGVISLNGDRAGFPNIVGEAMAYGLPVISSRVGGVCEVIQPKETGWLADTTEERVEALRQLIEDPQLREKVIRAARIWVESSFEVNRNVAQLLTYF